MIKHILTAFLLIIFIGNAFGQDTNYAREIILKLSSEDFDGRGYVDEGDRKTARFIRDEFHKHGIKPLVDNYFQPFNININTFPESLNVKIDGKNLNPGTEFLVSCSSDSDNGNYELFWLNAKKGNLDSLKNIADKHDLSDKYVVTGNSEKKITEQNIFKAAGIIVLQKNLWWRISNGHQVNDFTVLKVKKSAIDPEEASEITVKIQNNFLKDYQTQNVLGYIPGKENPEKYFFITAHYDHLGRMGKQTYFPGGNDNASGISMMMDLARHYSVHPPDVSIVFIAFGAEETGLEGSQYFAKNMPLDKEKVMFSLNLDMVGTGSDGITVVNGKVLHNYFNTLAAINKKKDYLKKIRKRGEAANSDHHFLYKEGIPAFFFYTLGDEYQEYHNLADKGKNVPLTEYEALFNLIKDYISRFPLKNELIR